MHAHTERLAWKQGPSSLKPCTNPHTPTLPSASSEWNTSNAALSAAVCHWQTIQKGAPCQSCQRLTSLFVASTLALCNNRSSTHGRLPWWAAICSAVSPCAAGVTTHESLISRLTGLMTHWFDDSLISKLATYCLKSATVECIYWWTHTVIPTLTDVLVRLCW